MTRVVVVGGGIAGLAAAHALSSGGFEVIVLESAPMIGGKLRVSDVAGVAVDEGAEMVLRRAPEAVDLISSLGYADDLIAPRTTTASVWARGALRPIPAGTVLGVPSGVRALRGVLSRAEIARAAADRILPGRAPDHDISVGDWVGRRLGRAVVDRLVDPLLGGVYAGRADHLSLAATMPLLPTDERSVLAAARRALPTPPAPGLAGPGVAGRLPDPVFAGLSGGLGRLPELLGQAIRSAGGSIRTSCTVRRLERGPDGWRVVHGATSDERVVDADAVIVAAPAVAAARLLADMVPAAAHELAVIEAASMAIVTTAWAPGRVAATGPAAGTSGYLVPAVYGRPVKAATFASTKWGRGAAAKDRASEEAVVVRCSIGRYGDITDLQRDDADLVAMAVTELTTHAGFAGGPMDSRVSRWAGGLPQYAVGHRDRVARIRAAVAAADGLEVCGATYDGVGVPACIRTGQDAARRAAAALRSR
jgi:oxygen-dependent protoporphyrinogen oxidase